MSNSTLIPDISSDDLDLEDDPAAATDPALYDDPVWHEKDESPSPALKQPTLSIEHIKHTVEAALFASGRTLSLHQLRELFENNQRPTPAVIKQCIVELQAHYQHQGVNLIEVSSGYRFHTITEVSTHIAQLWSEKPPKYSRALLETLSLIAYRQPITRSEIEQVRGVAVSSNIIRTLLEREWIRVVGHKDVPGRPAMYATTSGFLDYFNLSSLSQLPELNEIRAMVDIETSEESSSQSEPEQEHDSTSSFSAMVEKLRVNEQNGKTGSTYIDEQLNDELASMDAINKTFEFNFSQAKEVDIQNNESIESQPTASMPIIQTNDSELTDSNTTDQNKPEPINAEFTANPSTDLTEAEQWRIIEEKLKQQQALLDEGNTEDPPE